MFLINNLKEYIKYRKVILLFYLTIAILFPVIQWLYNLPLEAVVYTLIVVGFLLGIALVIDRVRFCQKNNRLREIKSNLSETISHYPNAHGAIEKSYREIIEGLHLIIEEQRTAAEITRQDLSEYYTMWVHQVKTPIAALDLLLQGRGDISAVSDQELFEIKQYVEMALDYTKLGNFSADLMISHYNLEEIVRHSVKRCATLFIYKKLSITVDEIDLTVETDSKWLTFILEQLLTNAVKYTPHGGIHIYLVGNSRLSLIAA